MPFRASGHDVALLALLGLVQLAIPCVLSVVCASTSSPPCSSVPRSRAP
jgi:hypothetical protein